VFCGRNERFDEAFGYETEGWPEFNRNDTKLHGSAYEVANRVRKKFRLSMEYEVGCNSGSTNMGFSAFEEELFCWGDMKSPYDPAVKNE